MNEKYDKYNAMSKEELVQKLMGKS
jgi:hypothetical protein